MPDSDLVTSSVDYQKNSFFYHTLELSSWRPIQGLRISINCIRGTPPVVVKGSRDPSMRSHRHPSLF